MSTEMKFDNDAFGKLLKKRNIELYFYPTRR